ncbi:NtaA/DmoA family FMN-dependent monooxygenase [Arenibacterium halophilum]|uniref:NtaA/DmoA family FMN-dependent monooxygenase n=1 Tax=Arenibacterium halophilum TaxID=2583821 RepID=A0ABY2X028_9RHOB|nr:NtaA/DmoA family FMN-dependent monooxygenase [Arenibacterium halophilum]TMV08269.1 NtaA/DmoA family FMN-dependent monooxygenase [Arenibacterium halophilum]
MTRSSQMHMVHMFFHSPITHTALSWANEDDGHLAGMASFAYWQDIARTLERGRFDAAFFADTPAASDQYRGSSDTPLKHGVVWPTHDPFPLAAVMTAATQHLGIGVTLSVTGNPPYLAHRRLSTLDYLSGGRIGWNIVTGHMQAEHKAIGQGLVPHDERYDMADEFMEICYALWDAYGEGALPMDKVSGVMAVPDRVKRLVHHGKYFQCEAVPATLPSPQGRPVIFQAGSSGRGMEFAVKHAEAIFAIQPHLAAMKRFREKFDKVAVEAGRDPIGILFGLQYVLGSTEAEANQRLSDLKERIPLDAGLSRLSAPLGVDCSTLDPDQPLEDVPTQASRGMAEALSQMAGDGRKITVRDAAIQMGLSVGLPQVVGSPEQVADQIETYWRESGGLGFNLSAPTKPGMITEFVDHVVPILQKRGIVRTDYEGTTLRDNITA